MESGGVEPHREAVDLARFTAELAAMFETLAQRAGLELTVDTGPDPCVALVDREMWAKIVLNLISNAVKATFTGGVTVIVRRVGDPAVVELQVRDTGIGIPHSAQDRLFERFHRVSGAELRSHEGSGIGLALVAELVNLHDGTVGVDSEPGEGSTFTVRVPAGSDDVGVEPTDETRPVDGLGAGFVAEATRWLGTSPAAPAQVVAGETSRARLLVVDDNADMRDYIVGLLHDQYEVRAAVDGVDALDTVRTWLPDLVLTDVMMPHLDGFGLLAALRAAPATLHVPVVMLSARTGEDASVAGLEAGADDYLVKPFTARELLARVHANLELDRVRRTADELRRSRELLDQAEALAHVGSWEIDLRDDSVRASAEYFRILGIPEDHLIDGGLATALLSVRADGRELLTAALARVREEGTPLDMELNLTHPDGTSRLVRARGLLVRDENGLATHVRGSTQDITEQRLAEQAVAATATAREAAAREHLIAHQLQRSLLPARIQQLDDLVAAAYYVAGTEGTQAGGDWYDVVPLEAGRTALVIGDVMGRGVRAAAVMGQLRAALRAYLRLDLPPDLALALLDQQVVTMAESTIVTCVIAVYDPTSATLTCANAGPTPPMIGAAGAGMRRLPANDPPLGTGRYRGRVETLPWPDGARLVLYTDGLVERRGVDLDIGIDHLAELLDGLDVPVEAVPNILADTLLVDDPGDDVAVLAVEPLAEREVSVAIRSNGEQVAGARAATVSALADWARDDPALNQLTDDAALVVSELVTNAIRYGQEPIELRLRRARQGLVVDVSDNGTDLPVLAPIDPLAPSGRGLRLVGALSDRWGCRPSGAGKSVWSLLSTRARPVTPEDPATQP